MLQMFSRLLQTTQALPRNPASISEDLAVEQQIQAELAAAVKEGMVTTRTQDHTLPSNILHNDTGEASPSTRLKKRKNGGGLDAAPAVPSAKRRRRTLGLDTDEEASHTIVSSPPENNDHAPVSRLHEGQTTRDTGEKRASKTHALQAAEVKTSAPGSPTTSVSIAPDAFTDGLKEMRQATAAGHLLDRNSRNSQSTSKTTSILKRGDSKYVEMDLVTSTKATHKRFGSNEPEELQWTQTNGTKSITVNGNGLEELKDDTSEDEAPEMVTATKGLTDSRITIAEAAKAAQRQAQAKRQKYRERDLILKRQAKSAKKHRRKAANILPDSESESSLPSNKSRRRGTNDLAPYILPKLSSKDPLPALLPDEILAIEPIPRSPTPPLDTPGRSISKPQKRRFLDADPKPIRDVKYGSVKVRVLEPDKPTLAPRTSKASKMLKEAWLAGRRGPKGGLESQRRKLGGGFLRK